jgi:hypothetical protein
MQTFRLQIAKPFSPLIPPAAGRQISIFHLAIFYNVHGSFFSGLSEEN